MAEYTVVKGDNLSKLAKKYNTTVAELARLNNIPKGKLNLIKIGQTLKLPDSAQAVTATQAASASAQPAAEPAPAGGGQPDTDWRSLINSIYDDLLNSQQTAIKGRYDAQKLELDTEKNKAPDIYNPLRSEAYTNNEMAERSRREAMANMGYSGAGGTSQTLQQRNTNALLTSLGDISRQQQDYTNNIDIALNKLGIQETAEQNSAGLQINSQRNQALLDQSNWAQNYGLQQDQINLSKGDSEFNRYMELYNKKLITKGQLKEKFPGLF
jgi:LysM repeat protein